MSRPPYWKSKFCELDLHPQCFSDYGNPDEGCTCDCHDDSEFDA